jgi:hypothetical protein
MYTKKLSWWTSFKKWLTSLYLVAFAFIFIVVGVILLLLPLLKNTVWQTIGGILLGTGLTILVTTTTAGQSSREQYRKEANLQRKIDVYGPFHAEMKVLREIFDKAHARTVPYPRWIEIPGVEHPNSLRFVNTTMLPTFYYWPTFKTDYRIDNFSPEAQILFNEVQNLTVAYGKAVENAREAMHVIIRPYVAASISKEEQSSNYQEWLRKRNSNTPENNRWFDFINMQVTTILPDHPLGKGISREWSVKIGWLIGDNPDQAALEVYKGDALNWDASQYSSLSWFQDIFEAAINDLKNDQTYRKVHIAQKELFTKLVEAETLLYKGLVYIRDRYEGGAPIV